MSPALVPFRFDPVQSLSMQIETTREDGVGDGLYILAPDDNLIQRGNQTQDFNDASYVVLYRSAIGRILLAGDAHDATWDHVKKHYESDVSNVDLLIAPHHGRKSGRSYEFLDYVNPKLTLFGCASSDHLAYDAWNYRDLSHITNNQCGCIVAEGDDVMNIYVENRIFAEKSGGNPHLRNTLGFYFLGQVVALGRADTRSQAEWLYRKRF